jgi:hypothetical protein
LLLRTNTYTNSPEIRHAVLGNAGSRWRRGCVDAREAVKALIVANQFLETELEKLRAAVSTGYARGKLSEAAKAVPRDRKDWYD